MNAISATEAPHLQQIDLTKLTMIQLRQLKRQIDQELTLFQDSLQTLKIAQIKYQRSGESLEEFTPEFQGKPILVPLTGSMYVPGKLADPSKVIIDIGTGYYAEKTTQEAKDYFKRKTAFVTDQMEKIQCMGLEKSKIRDAIVDVMEMKAQTSTS